MGSSQSLTPVSCSILLLSLFLFFIILPSLSVKLMVTLDPLITYSGSMASFSSSQDASRVYPRDTIHFSRSNAWIESIQGLNKGTRRRSYSLFGKNVNGEEVFLPRYIRPLHAPSHIHSVLEAIHFVSMIPFIEDYQAFSHLMDVYCNVQEFLDLQAGDSEVFSSSPFIFIILHSVSHL